jgi:hypothetical protein
MRVNMRALVLNLFYILLTAEVISIIVRGAYMILWTCFNAQINPTMVKRSSFSVGKGGSSFGSAVIGERKYISSQTLNIISTAT